MLPACWVAEQFMNDSLHCQSDSPLAWDLGGREADGPLRTSHARARAFAGGAPAGPLICWGRDSEMGFPVKKKENAHHWLVKDTFEVPV